MLNCTRRYTEQQIADVAARPNWRVWSLLGQSRTAIVANCKRGKYDKLRS